MNTEDKVNAIMGKKKKSEDGKDEAEKPSKIEQMLGKSKIDHDKMSTMLGKSGKVSTKEEKLVEAAGKPKNGVSEDKLRAMLGNTKMKSETIAKSMSFKKKEEKEKEEKEEDDDEESE